ncbi:hypothetical protein VZT92_005445 [Zoarces viviparus]|uniref:Uncharacterized protein n=1 Tax=Zoarces viviparus TaxID=48416 RepID=A0AAW1FUG6_ZOAVI
MHVRMRLPPAPPPPRLHRRCPAFCIPPRRTRHCSRGCDSRSSFSISRSFASAASSKASISHKHPSTSEQHTPPLSQISFLQQPCVVQASSQAVPTWASLPLFPSARLGSPPQQSPISRRHHPLSVAPGRKKQASCLFFLQKCLLAGQLVFHCPFGG